MVAGMDLICLFVMQHSGQGILIIMALILFQNVLSTVIWWKSVDVIKQGKFTAISLYMDVECPTLQIIFLFIGQVALFVFFLSTLFKTENDLFYEITKPDKVPSYTFWLVSYIAVQMSAIYNRGADSQLGDIWPTSFWQSLLANNESLEFAAPKFGHGGFGDPFEVSTCSLAVRQVMGWTTKSVMRDGVAFVVPLFLMQSDEPMDFVLNCLAVAFITTIDQISNKDIQVTSKDMSEPLLEQ
jgi:hypothetical protein